jgi:hypothetical protein
MGENCTSIRSRFSMPTPCSPVRQPPTRHAQLQDLGAGRSARRASSASLALYRDERVQVAVAGVEHVRHLQTVLGTDLRDAAQHLRQARERNSAVHAVVVGDAAHGAEAALRPFQMRALCSAELLASTTFGSNERGDLDDVAQQAGDLVLEPSTSTMSSASTSSG